MVSQDSSKKPPSPTFGRASAGHRAVIKEETQDPDFDDELTRMPSGELAQKAQEYKENILNGKKTAAVQSQGTHNSLVSNVLGGQGSHRSGTKRKKGAFAGVFIPTCENMWGVLIFLRFYVIVGQAGVGQALLAVLLSFSCAFCTTSSMSATVSSGGVVSQGGPYYMISRALGPCVGASVGIMYWLAITMLCVLETLGAVEGILMITDDALFTGCRQVYGSALMAGLALFVYGGINLVTKLGILFAAIVFVTLFMFYFGLAMAPETPQAPANVQSNPYVTGINWETLRNNWGSHYTDGKDFGYVLSVFFPCFTGILSGANRADILRDPPKNLRQGTFGAIIFSLFMYSSYMVLWGMVASYEYLQGEHMPPGEDVRRLAGGEVPTYVIDEIVWNPFPHAAKFGIIFSSLSQALQCLVVSPRLLNAIAKDEILNFLNPLAPLHGGEPKRALGATYLLGAMLVLLGNIDVVAPLLSMCFLVAYAFMNFSCFALTWLKSPAWRPKGIQRKRWRLWYICTSLIGFIICLTIMITIDPWWALAANTFAVALYAFINWRLEARGWGSAMDGIRFQLALSSLVRLEEAQKYHVNWRPQVLILYRIHLAEELKGIKDHEILRFYCQLRKGNGFCVVACVLEADRDDATAIRKARIEKDVIKSIMNEENIQGFAEVVVAPSWVEGTNYIIQLTGIGGLVPNTVMLDWPNLWQKYPKKAREFVDVLRTALAEDKAVLAIRGLRDMPRGPCHGTIDIWWMIHDGGFLILLSWLLVQHRVWRQCHLRVFTITEGVTEVQAQAAADLLTKTLRLKRLFDVDVEVILADDEMIEPYTYDWTLRVEERHRFLEQLNHQPTGSADDGGMEGIPLEIEDLFHQTETAIGRSAERSASKQANDHGNDDSKDRIGCTAVTDLRQNMTERGQRDSCFVGDRTNSGVPKAKGETKKPTESAAKPASLDLRKMGEVQCAKICAKVSLDGEPKLHGKVESPTSQSREHGKDKNTNELPETPTSQSRESDRDQKANEFAETTPTSRSGKSGRAFAAGDGDAFHKLNQIIYSRSKRAQLVVMNLPDLWGNEPEQVEKFMSYCETLTSGLDRVLFVHSSGHEIFDLNK